MLALRSRLDHLHSQPSAEARRSAQDISLLEGPLATMLPASGEVAAFPAALCRGRPEAG